VTRSSRFLEAVRELETWRYGQKARTPDLFTVPTPAEPDAWKDAALAAISAVARTRTELTVEDIPFAPAVDNRARGSRRARTVLRGRLQDPPVGRV